MDKPTDSNYQLAIRKQQQAPTVIVPSLIAEAGEKVQNSFKEFFLANIPNLNTREAYSRAIAKFFNWIEKHRQVRDLLDIETLDVVAWVDAIKSSKNQKTGKVPANATVQQHVAAVSSLFNWFKLHQLITINPVSAVKLKREKLKHGKTSVLSGPEARHLIDSIQTEKQGQPGSSPIPAGLRDQTLIALMLFTFARISAAVSITLSGISEKDGRLFITLNEKGGKQSIMPCHHQLEAYLRKYLTYLHATQELSDDTPLFQSMDRHRLYTGRALTRNEAWYMVRRRAKAAGIDVSVCNHTFRATGITKYLENPDARIEHAQEMAGHADPSTTLLYDHRKDKITQREVERIDI